LLDYDILKRERKTAKPDEQANPASLAGKTVGVQLNLNLTNREKKMITVANRIFVKAEYGEAFERVFRERARLVDEMPGFVSNQVLRPVNDGEPYVVFTIWQSRADFMNWVGSEAFVKGHAQSGTLPKDAYFQGNILEMHEVVQDSARPDLPPEPRGGEFKMH